MIDKTLEIKCLAALIVVSGVASAQTFTGLGDLPGGSYFSFGYGACNGGGVAVGNSNSSAPLSAAFRWTDATGIQPLGWTGRARAISGDGIVVAGDVETSGNQLEAVRWTEVGGMQLLGRLQPTHTRSFAVAASQDGSVVVGSSNGGAPLRSEAFRWTEADGLVGLGFLSPSHTFATANDVSDDGSVVVGLSRVSSSGLSEAFRWTPQDGMVGLGWLPAHNSSGASAVSADGTVIVGGSFTVGAVGSTPVLWTQAGGIQSLGLLPGYTACDPTGVSPDGSVVTGTCFGTVNRPFIWTAAGGIRRLDTALANEFGLNITGWQLSQANGLSPDGRAIIGFGLNPSSQPEAFLVVLPGPCVGDLDDSGAVDLQDLSILLAHFGQASGANSNDGDTDGDGDVDLQDLSTLIARFGTSC